jgi:hypothetical protein
MADRPGRVARGLCDALRADDRGLSPVVGKTLELGLVVLYLAFVTTALYGGVVPDYRTAAGASVADRTLASGAERIEAAIPPNASHVVAERRVSLPTTIRGEQYRVEATNRTAIALRHPNPEIGGRARLVLPGSVVSVAGTWRSGSPAVVTVSRNATGLVVELGAAG